MKRILVIGARGMLGRELIGVLQSAPEVTGLGWEVHGWDIEEIDICEERETISKIEGLRPSIIVHLAAFTAVDACESEIEKAFAVNAEGTRHVALGASRCGASMAYLSTDYVFDGTKGKPYIEEDPPQPLNVYGRSKLMGERYVEALCSDALIVRTQWLFGKHGNNFITSIVGQAREGREVRVVNDQTGVPTYTLDLAKALWVLLQHGARGIFHVVNNGSCTWYEFARTIFQFLGLDERQVVPISSHELGRPAARPAYSILSCRKLEREMGLTLRSWSEALEEYLQYLKPEEIRRKGVS